MAKIKDKDGLIDRVKKFMKDNSDTFELNNDDFKVSKRVASGLGWGSEDRKIWGDDRAEVTVNILRPYVNKLVAMYDSNPFGLGIKNIGPQQRDLSMYRFILDYVLKTSDFNVVISDAIRETVNDGIAYVLAYHEDNGSGSFDIKLKKLDNRSVFFSTDCKEANGSDAKMVVHADVIDKQEAKDLYDFTDMEFRQSDILQGFDVIDNNKKQCGLITVYEKVNEGVKISKIVHSKVVDETVLPIKNIPIVRFYGEKVTLEDLTNWRGAYYFVADLLRSINFYASLQQERVACSPTTGYLVASESLDGKDSQFAKINGAPRAYLAYKAYDQNGNALPVPTKVQQEAQIADVTSSITGFQNIVTNILGDAGTTEPAINETAESVLLRKSNNEASISLYIRNAKDSSIAIGRVILQMIAMVFDVPRLINEVNVMPVDNIEGLDIIVENGPIAASQKEKNVRQLVAFGQMVANNPEAAKLAPVIIENLDIDPKAKQFLMMQYGQNQQGQIPPQVQQQMVAKDQQIAQMTAQMAEQKNLISQLQMSLFEYQKDSKAMIIKTQMEIESKERIELWKLQAAKGELNAELEAKQQMQSQKLIADYMKEMNKFEKPEVMPSFNAGRFVPTVMR